jgi:hypothetical protein
MAEGYCSLCFTRVESKWHFPAHALICAGQKRGVREPDEEEIRQMILDNRVDDVRELLENEAVPPALISIQYARSPEMCRLLLDHGADRFQYIEHGRVALEEAGLWFNIRDFLPRTEPGYAMAFMTRLIKLRDAHYALETSDPNARVTFTFMNNEKEWPNAGEFSESDQMDEHHAVYSIPRPAEVVGRSFLEEMVYHGFLPSCERLEHAYFRRYSERSLEFWSGLDDDIWNCFEWDSNTIHELQRGVSENPQTFALMIAGLHHLIFKKSHRAKTDMSMFRTVDSKVVYNIEPWQKMIPVTRYAQGMSGGLFYNYPENHTYCGTFYYREPESNAFLKYNSSLVAKDKSHAVELLGMRHLTKDYTEFERMARTSDLMFTPRELFQYVDELKKARVLDKDPWRIHQMRSHRSFAAAARYDEKKYYAGHTLGLYAFDDNLDQHICVAASKQGYDVVILERMVGSRQIVTEVLDARPRDESFKNLYFLEKE